MGNRPNPKQLQNTNILKDLPPEIIGDGDIGYNKNGKMVPLDIKMDNGIDLNGKLKQRPSWKELNDRGILLDDPTTKKSHSLQAAQRTLHKRKASIKLDKMLMNRPNPKQLQNTNILK